MWVPSHVLGAPAVEATTRECEQLIPRLVSGLLSYNSTREASLIISEVTNTRKMEERDITYGTGGNGSLSEWKRVSIAPYV